MVADFRCRERTRQQPLRDCVKIGKLLIQRDQKIRILQLRNPDNIQPGHIGHLASAAADLKLLMQLIPRKSHRIHLNARILLLKLRDQLLGQGFLFRRSCTVMMPERYGYLLLRLLGIGIPGLRLIAVTRTAS
ncbi:hypothetical protein D3C71_1673810 [compost metagenome]